MVSTRTGKTGAFPSQGKVRNFAKTGKVREFYPKYWKISEKIMWKIGKTTGEVREICQPVMVKTLQIQYHSLNLKNNLKYRKTAKTTGKVGEICQCEKVGTMVMEIKFLVLNILSVNIN